ncbi:hypothetical protein GCM10025878_14310 [Leuconostoc gasicomitatum]|uniref:hypothetical protein n=1 Tax=Leuconostoc gasicomitatum TaxID=115778 RepID=UPI0001DB5814|nr:hypothetical protein [Leuconostoc gasicomitatum]GMA06360.1 hypothetical protein GCM10025878_14310 [Leuconostoc gasicomitatum]CBL92259.1 hypothetical protein LEGAS_1611 [Leuconostoc gasicomitatum LMG 18811]
MEKEILELKKEITSLKSEVTSLKKVVNAFKYASEDSKNYTNSKIIALEQKLTKY